jgi:hypothetical protein
MNTKHFAHALLASSLLLSSAVTLAGDDIFDKQKDAAEERLDKAQDGCEKFTGNAQDTCEAKAKATYEQEILSFEKQQEEREKPVNPQPSNTPSPAVPAR